MKRFFKKNKFKIIFWTSYSILLLALFFDKFISRTIHAFLVLIGKRNPWFVFSPSGPDVVIPLPEPEDDIVPSFPDPDFGNIPIITGTYWRSVLEIIGRGIIIALMLIIVVFIVRYVAKQLEILIRKDSTLPYRIYTKKIKPHTDKFFNFIRRKWNKTWIYILDKKNLLLVILVFLFFRGILLNFVIGFFNSFIAIFLTGPANWVRLHIKAILYGVYVFVSGFKLINLFIAFALLYFIFSFVFAYSQFRRNERKIEEYLADLPFGIQFTGRSGAGKTSTMQAFASAAQRNARKNVKEYCTDIESAYGHLVSFNTLRAYFDSNKNNIVNSITARDYAHEFINKYNIKNIHIDRFKGITPSLHTNLEWWFIGQWLLKKETTLIQSTFPGIVNDPENGKEIRETVYDLLTNRVVDVPFLILDQNMLRKTLSAIEVIYKNDGTKEFKIKKGIKESELTLTIEPASILMWHEFDKDFGFSVRSEIIENESDKILAIIRHFQSFDNRTFGHFFYDSQATDAVANVMRSKFDFSLCVIESQHKNSVFLKPYIWFIQNRLRFWHRFKETIETFTPFKNSFLRVFIRWRLKSLKRLEDYLTYFDYWDLRVVPQNAKGDSIDKNRRLKLNLANVFYQYATVTYQEIYDDMKRKFKASKTADKLSRWNTDLKMKVTDLDEINSDFAKSIFGQKTEKERRAEEEAERKKAEEEEIKLEVF